MSFDDAAYLLGSLVVGASFAVVVTAVLIHEGKRRVDLARLLAGFGAVLREWGEKQRSRPET
ncbi:MAG: hypothetical protein JOZ90_12395 [Alphaproteobacteria bacterium]|nr:hypothetical protein [Alphaproteobacteria bacterium]MBV9372122.1 hypothetical protein [Alphaproteobacteria bacterium]MBV9901874.1 hypothetical protein [Alphaproteobacteria bacterium]